MWMFMPREGVLLTDCFGYHITNIESMESICKEGLKPMLGERSISIGETEKRIFFTCCLNEIPKWIGLLYEKRNIEELELLRFNIKRRKWHMRVGSTIYDPQEFYLEKMVKPKSIEYTRIIDLFSDLPLDLDSYDYSNAEIEWRPLETYLETPKALVKRENK